MKMIYYKPIEVTIDVLGLAKIMINVVMRYYSLSNSNVIDQSSLFTSKFWLLLSYFLGIKQKISIIFHSQTDV